MNRPNILFILTDDQGVWAAGCYGNKEIRTPGIDRVASTGIRFDNFFVETPVCSPSRATFLTGRIASQHGIHDWIREGNIGSDAACYLEGELAYTDVLAQAGWVCGISGKWHLGHSQQEQHGFEHWYVHQQGGGDYNNAPMIRNGELIEEPGYVTDAITEDALSFIDRHGNGEQPFYLGVHYTAPHSPWTGHPQAIVDSYEECPFESCPQEAIHEWAVDQPLTQNCMGNREMLKGYFASVTAMDMGVVKLLNKLEALGIRESTLVIFTSDNGFSCGHHGFWGKGNGTSPLNMYENSIKVPFLVSQPGIVNAGSAVDGLVCSYDFMPTLLEFVGCEVPSTRNLPGLSFAHMLNAGASETSSSKERDLIVTETAQVGFGEYGKTRMVRTPDWKYIHRFQEGPHELYHLSEDPGEHSNLSGDVAYQRRSNEFQGILQDWYARYATDCRRDGRFCAVTGKGQLRPVDGTSEANEIFSQI